MEKFQNQELRLKVQLKDGDIRRCSLSPPINFQRLVELLESFQAGSPGNFTIQYLDDENELISIYSDTDLIEALNLMEEMNQKFLKLKITMSENDPQKRSKRVNFAQPSKQEAEPKNSDEENDEKNNEQFIYNAFFDENV